MNSETQTQSSLSPLSLGIENGLEYVQSQHTCECAYDSIQMILFFADGFRQVFGQYAELVLNQAYSKKDEIGDDKFNLFKFFNLDPLFEAVVGNYFGIEATNPHAQYLRSFLARAIRRYVMIKLQDGGWTMEHVLQAFGIASVQTTCLAPFKSDGGALRRASFNESAGFTTAELLMSLAGKSIKLEEGAGEFMTEGADSMAQIKSIVDTLLDGILSPKPTLKSLFTVTTTYDATKFDNLVGILIVSYSAGGGHANTILRYRNDFYYCDNNVGMALRLDPPLTSEIVLKGDSITFQYATKDDPNIHFYINGKEHARGPSRPGVDTDLFSSGELLYFYANEPIGLSSMTAPISPPPKLKPVVVTNPSVASNRITGTSSTFGAYWNRKTADAKVAFARRFSKTQRAERPIAVGGVTSGSLVAKRFSRTLRAAR